ncbi:MAG: phosphoribosylaminoimidazolesuccinocarboxamide synthase [Armatimonadota bacterium]
MKKIAEGKTKIIFQNGSKDEVIILSKDKITAGDGAKVNVIKDKGVYANKTTCNCYTLLNMCGIKTHFISGISDDSFKALKCDMIPLEVVVRRIAFGSYLKRNPGVKEGYVFGDLLQEFFLKDDARHDPIMTYDEIIEAKLKAGKRIIKASDLEFMIKEAKKIFKILERAWLLRDVTLVDLKAEFGITEHGELVLADVIDNDSWRIWPGGKLTEMKDKQVYRNLSKVTKESLSKIADNYRWVADTTDDFCRKTAPHAVIFMGSEKDKSHADEIIKVLKGFGIGFDVNILSAHKNTEKLLNMLKYYNHSYPYAVFIAVAGRSNALGPVLDGNTLYPVINCPPPGSAFGGMDILSSLRLPSNMACTTILEPGNAALAAVKILAQTNLPLWAKLNLHCDGIKGE